MKTPLPHILLALALCSCSSDDPTAPAEGQYVAEADGIVAAVRITGGECGYFTLYYGGEVVNSYINRSDEYRYSHDIDTEGSYPVYTYRSDEWTIQASFDGSEAFTATLSGTVSPFGVNQPGPVSLTGRTLRFVRSDRVLDAYGDGILDDMQ